MVQDCEKTYSNRSLSGTANLVPRKYFVSRTASTVRSSGSSRGRHSSISVCEATARDAMTTSHRSTDIKQLKQANLRKIRDWLMTKSFL